MADETAGGFEYRGRSFRFKQAECRWEPGGELFIDATGDRCGLSLVGVPFPGATELTELPGKVWEPDDEQLSQYADTFAEGGIEVRDKELWIMGGRIECRRFDPEQGVLTVSFRLAVQDGEYGRENEVDGVAYCRVISHDASGP